MKIKEYINYFTKWELTLWSLSVIFIGGSYILFDRSNSLALIASLIGATALIFCAKGNPFGQFLMIIFGIIYGWISYGFAYYGEMLTYVGMTVPMAVLSFVTWLKNPYKGKKSQVTVNKVKKNEIGKITLLTTLVTIIFYFILKYFNTANLITSTFSVTTSFLAVYLTYRRSPLYALAYALNDIVLIILWSLASIEDISYISVVICFIVFLANDINGYLSWKKMYKNQNKKSLEIKKYYFLHDDAKKIRYEVFVEEQGFTDEYDDTDNVATHLVMYKKSAPIACCRYFITDNKSEYYIGRMAVLKEFRGKKIGAKMITECEKQIKSLGGKSILLHAQLQAKAFYEKMGYIPFKEPDSEQACPHIWMKKEIAEL